MSKTEPILTAPFKYAELGKTPEGYKCGVCGATGVKLWREYNTFLDYQRLFCVTCGRDGGPEEFDRLKPITATEWGECDQITHPKHGSLVPAVPDEDGQTYWGYTSIPAMGCIWWRSLRQPDWTDEIVLRDFAQYEEYRDLFRKNDSDYYKKLLAGTEEALEVLRGEIVRRKLYNEQPPGVQATFCRYPPGRYLVQDGAPYAITAPGTEVVITAYNESGMVQVAVMKSNAKADANVRALSAKHGKNFTSAEGFAAVVDPKFLVLLEVVDALRYAYQCDA